jgi:hypothetical protein
MAGGRTEYTALTVDATPKRTAGTARRYCSLLGPRKGMPMAGVLWMLEARRPRCVRRREIPDFALHRRNFIPLFYGVSEIFLRPREILL